MNEETLEWFNNRLIEARQKLQAAERSLADLQRTTDEVEHEIHRWTDLVRELEGIAMFSAFVKDKP